MFEDDDEPAELLPVPELSEDVKALINNGLDFLEQAREELKDSKPKFSLVSFWTAVELLLKVPLAHEHWSLICSRKSAPKKQSYRNGDFQSISYDETRMLLRDVLEKPLSEDTHNIFDKVRKHRNRLVHFYHTEFSETQMTQILNEQGDAWFRLNQLIRKDWRPIFGEDLYQKLTNDDSRLVRTSHYYSNAKFRALGSRLKELRQAGEQIVKCPTCNKKAGRHSVFNEDSDNSRHEIDCLVCGYVTDLYLEVSCPDCSGKQRIERDDPSDFECVHCKHTVPRYELLDESTESPEDHMLRGGTASCSDCEGIETICEFGGSYLCVQCLEIHDSVSACEYCNTLSTHVQDMSGLFGCGFCEGNTKLMYND